MLFEPGQCRACDDMHEDVFPRPATRVLLARFDVVLLGMWSKTPVQAPDGRTRGAASWARELGIAYAPTLVSFDVRGREVFRAEAYLKAFHL
ncbi:MAG: hypothetical protein B7Z66_08450 [Chromatiales bacterium 21-64-14]|nr:MAG: hypothetical protein B7Z66_08450 [Chromatiales bacterium 21-64-14]HQU15366.1 hypothetical protein [Gammaproteobacteria bacterium]